jgi:hypothetical protein
VVFVFCAATGTQLSTSIAATISALCGRRTAHFDRSLRAHVNGVFMQGYAFAATGIIFAVQNSQFEDVEQKVD